MSQTSSLTHKRPISTRLWYVFFILLRRAAHYAITTYVTFVHLLDGTGTLIAQQDRPPLGGYRPTSGWQPGNAITDRFAFPLDAPTADLRVAVGWYTWPSLERLPVRAHGRSLPDDRLILPVAAP